MRSSTIGARRAAARGRPVDDFEGESVGPLNEFEGEDGDSRSGAVFDGQGYAIVAVAPEIEV